MGLDNDYAPTFVIWPKIPHKLYGLKMWGQTYKKHLIALKFILKIKIYTGTCDREKSEIRSNTKCNASSRTTTYILWVVKLGALMSHDLYYKVRSPASLR
jgi:hypothetical protein